jgi:hypothetical protein
MVNRPAVLIASLLLALLPGTSLAFRGDAAPAAGPDAEAISAVREAFSAGSFPWYDASADDYRPVMPRAPSAPRQEPRFNLAISSLQELGRLVIFLLLAAALTGMVLFVARTWRRRPDDEAENGPARPARVSGSTSRIEALPTGLEVDESDPLEAARVFRDRGDRARAVVLLFAHQLLLLDRVGRIRLAPGRTGRQLVRSIEDDALRARVSRTLLLFEEAYYGHREPDPETFDALWAEAEALDARLSSGVSA